MRWKFWERRSSGYTDLIIDAIIQASEGTAKSAHATATLEAAAGLYQAAFSAARLDPLVPALGPSLLGEAARRLIRYGEVVYLIEVEEGKIRLRPVSSWTITGRALESSWRYRLEVPGPTASDSISVPADAVVHLRYSTDPLTPWKGLGPMQHASATGTLAGSMEQRLGEESGAPSALLLPVPADGGDGGSSDPLANLKSDIKKAKGKPVMLKTTSGGWGEGPGSAPQRDWQQSRIGASPPDTLVDLRSQAALSVLSACLVPVSLVTDADGTSQREAWRRFIMGAVEPLSQRMAEEFTRKLDLPSLDFRFRSLWASDLIGRTQAFQRLVQGGMGIPEAVQAAGIMAE